MDISRRWINNSFLLMAKNIKPPFFNSKTLCFENSLCYCFRQDVDFTVDVKSDSNQESFKKNKKGVEIKSIEVVCECQRVVFKKRLT